MVVGYSRVCYSRRCRFYRDDNLEADIEFYWAPPGALPLPFPTVFWPYNNWSRKPNVPWIIGEDTSQRIRYSKGALPWPDIDGQHYEGTPEDFMGLSYRPGGLYRAYLPAAVPPACDFRPALGFLGSGEVPSQTANLRSRLGWLGGSVQICPNHTGALGFVGRGILVVPTSDGLLGLLGTGQLVTQHAGLLGFVGGAFCGDDPRFFGSGNVDASLGTLTCSMSGSVHVGDYAVSLAANFDATLTLTSSGIVGGVLPPEITGSLAASVDASPDAETASDYIPPEITGSLDEILDPIFTGDIVGGMTPPEITGSLDEDLDSELSSDSNAEVVNPADPIGISGLAGAYFSDEEVYQEDTYSTPATANNDTVGGWKCSRGIGPDLPYFNGTGVLKTGIQNGLPAIRFTDGSTAFRGALGWAAAQAYTIFVVYSDRAIAGGARRVVQGGSGVNYILGPYAVFHAMYAAGFVSLVSPVTTNVFVTSCATDDNISIQKHYINGTEVASGGGSQGYNPMNVRLGWCSGDGYPEGHTGDVLAVLYYDRYLTTGERDDIVDYLQTKYAHY